MDPALVITLKSPGVKTALSSRIRQKKHASKVPPCYASRLECDHFEECSGCTINEHLDTPRTLNRAAAYFSERGHPEFKLNSGHLHGWRRRARLAVRRDAKGHLCVGLFAAGTHDVVDIPACVAHHPTLNAVADIIRRVAVQCHIKPYDERTGKGQLRYVQLALVDPAALQGTSQAAGGDGQVQVVLVWNDSAASGLKPSSSLLTFAKKLWEAAQAAEEGSLLHSIHANFHTAPTNAILGPETALLLGAPEAWTLVAGTHISFDPGSFMQANPGSMTAAVESMRQWVPPGSAVADLHAGVGTIGLCLAATQKLGALRLVELNPAGEEAFWRSWRRMQEAQSGGELPSNVEYHVAAAGSDPGRWLNGVDVAVLDPPRKGLEPDLLQYFCSIGPADGERKDNLRRLLYLSCGWPALERDCTALLDSGRWSLAGAESFLFFPGTDHIETLAVFDRATA